MKLGAKSDDIISRLFAALLHREFCDLIGAFERAEGGAYGAPLAVQPAFVAVSSFITVFTPALKLSDKPGSPSNASIYLWFIAII